MDDGVAMSRRARLTWLLTLGIAGSATGIATWEARRAAASRPLASVAGRLGPVALGPAASPAWSWRGVDARREPRCPATEAPIPGGVCFAPDHGLAWP